MVKYPLDNNNFAFRKFYIGVRNANIVIIFKILLTMPQKIRFI